MIVITYAHYADNEARELQPKVVIVDENNAPIPLLTDEIAGTTARTTR